MNIGFAFRLSSCASWGKLLDLSEPWGACCLPRWLCRLNERVNTRTMMQGGLPCSSPVASLLSGMHHDTKQNVVAPSGLLSVFLRELSLCPCSLCSSFALSTAVFFLSPLSFSVNPFKRGKQDPPFSLGLPALLGVPCSWPWALPEP